jgi:uncharacterized protein (DUF1501 family)
MTVNRRQFVLRSGHALGAAALFSSLGFLRVAQASDYKALVCVFLFGGNDGNNILIPTDSTGYAAYNLVRPPSSNLNIPQANWLPISASGKSFGMHPNFTNLQGLYTQGRLAWVANVGTLVQPTTRAKYLAGSPVPDNLFSHSDQQYQWQTATTAISPNPSGWGGRLADEYTSTSSGTHFPLLANLDGVTVFTQGVSSGVISPGSSATTLQGFGTSAFEQARHAAFLALQGQDTSNTLGNALNVMTANGLAATQTLNQALAGEAALTTVFPNNSLSSQLKTVAQMIAARSTLGVSRQIFFCALNGFDTHTNQLATQGPLISQLDQALSAFHQATVELGVEGSVTTFTHSDFGRTFQPTEAGGSDHAWGSHHLVMGGSVNGGHIFGQYPTLKLAGPDDADSEGRWVPSTGVTEYVYPLIRWFGATNIPQVLPNITNFNLSRADLGFI